MATTEDRRKLDGTAEWRRELYDAAPEREGELLSTITGLPNEPVYTPDSVEIDYDRDLGYPGVYPFTRGVYPSMYRGKLWTMRGRGGVPAAMPSRRPGTTRSRLPPHEPSGSPG